MLFYRIQGPTGTDSVEKHGNRCQFICVATLSSKKSRKILVLRQKSKEIGGCGVGRTADNEVAHTTAEPHAQRRVSTGATVTKIDDGRVAHGLIVVTEQIQNAIFSSMRLLSNKWKILNDGSGLRSFTSRRRGAIHPVSYRSVVPNRVFRKSQTLFQRSSFKLKSAIVQDRL